jgi:hypothetical protein
VRRIVAPSPPEPRVGASSPPQMASTLSAASRAAKSASFGSFALIAVCTLFFSSCAANGVSPVTTIGPGGGPPPAHYLATDDLGTFVPESLILLVPLLLAILGCAVVASRLPTFEQLQGRPAAVTVESLQRPLKRAGLLKICSWIPVLVAFCLSSIGLIANSGTCLNPNTPSQQASCVAGTASLSEQWALSLLLITLPAAGAYTRALQSLIAGFRASGLSAVAASSVNVSPELRRFVEKYAERRLELEANARLRLANSVEPALRTALPEIVDTDGPLAALDALADRVEQKRLD